MSSQEEKNSYQQIMKATSIFGGVQVFNILISIIRSKAIAILLGPAGLGIVGLLTSTTGLIGSLTNFGLGTSAVKDIAEAHANNDEEQMAKTTSFFKKLVWLTGGLGTLVTLILSPWLSQLTFGNKDYTWAFVFLSISLLITQLTEGQNVILQGTRKLKHLAFANMLGSIASLFIALPLYYFYGKKGIVPGIIIMGLSSLFIAIHFSARVKIKKIKTSFKNSLKQGKGMLKLGFLLSLSGIITVISSYILRIYISKTGGITDVGLYVAGFQIINTYVGLIFTAMVTDYYPRLAGVTNNQEKSNLLINQQSEIAVLILGPILLVFIVLINWILIALYSKSFIIIDEMMKWAALGMFFKAASWPIGFVFLAKGESKIFFKSELIANIYFLFFNIIGYKYLGFLGLGISFLVNYFLIYVQVYLISYFKYNFVHKYPFYRVFTVQIILSITGLILIYLPFSVITQIFITILIIIISIIFSFLELNKRLGLFKKLKWI